MPVLQTTCCCRWFAQPSNSGPARPSASSQLPAEHAPQPLTPHPGPPQHLPTPQHPPQPHPLAPSSVWPSPSPCLVRTQGRSRDLGLRWHLQEQLWGGPPSGSASACTLAPPRSAARVLFLHGFLGSAQDWAPIAAALSTTHLCVCLDLPGHGGSSLQGEPGACLVKGLSWGRMG